MRLLARRAPRGRRSAGAGWVAACRRWARHGCGAPAGSPPPPPPPPPPPARGGAPPPRAPRPRPAGGTEPPGVEVGNGSGVGRADLGATGLGGRCVSIGVLGMAIGLRCPQYGITEPRYFLVLLSVWLAAIACWFTFTRSRNIGVIPVSLCALALLTFAGPTSAYSVSRRSQLNRLERALNRNKLLDAGGKLQAPAGVVPDSDRVAITAGLTYLLDTHGHEAVLPWLSDSAAKKLGTGKGRHHRYEGGGEASKILASIKMEPLRSLRDRTSGYFSFSVRGDLPTIAIDGFTHLVHVTAIRRQTETIVSGPVTLRPGSDSASLELVNDSIVVLRLPLQAVADSIVATGPKREGRGAYRVDVAAGEYGARLYLNSVYGFRRAGRAIITGVDGRLLLRIPKQSR